MSVIIGLTKFHVLRSYAHYSSVYVARHGAWVCRAQRLQCSPIRPGRLQRLAKCSSVQIF